MQALHLKLENLQVTGSYKIRGITVLLEELDRSAKVITMSAGNFGRSFAYMTSQRNISATIVMPDTVAQDRVKAIEGYGATVILKPKKDLQQTCNDMVQNNGMKFCHPFDTPSLFRGYGSIGLEILEDVPNADIIVVPIGGGGLISGIAAAIKLSGSKAKIVGVEPEGAPSMHLSLQKGHAVTLEKMETMVHGLSPPYAGTNCYQVVKTFVDEVVLVSDEEIKEACCELFLKHKTVAEYAGCAAMAAILNQKGNILSNVANKVVVCLVSGGNVSPDELATVSKRI